MMTQRDCVGCIGQWFTPNTKKGIIIIIRKHVVHDEGAICLTFHRNSWSAAVLEQAGAPGAAMMSDSDVSVYQLVPFVGHLDYERGVCRIVSGRSSMLTKQIVGIQKLEKYGSVGR